MKLTKNILPTYFENALPTPWFRLYGIPCPIIAHTGSTGFHKLHMVNIK